MRSLSRSYDRVTHRSAASCPVVPFEIPNVREGEAIAFDGSCHLTGDVRRPIRMVRRTDRAPPDCRRTDSHCKGDQRRKPVPAERSGDRRHTEEEEQQGDGGPQALRDGKAIPEREGTPDRCEHDGQPKRGTGDQAQDPRHHIVPFWPPVRHPWRPSLRQAVGVRPDQRRKARLKALASE